MSSWPESGTRAHGGWGAFALLFGLIVLGWTFALAQVLTMDTPGSLAEAGPGMQIFAYVKAYVFGDPFAFESSLSFCASQTGVWGVADVLKSSAMWLGMILAMMLPVLLPLGRSTSGVPLPPGATTAGLTGYVIAWLPFCALGVAAQWILQREGVLSAHLVLQHDGLSASILLIVAMMYLSGLARRSETRTQTNASAQSFRTGLAYGLHCLRCCGPLMLVMFITGLMNLVAMLVLTLLMVVTMSGPNRFLFIAIGTAALAGATAFALT
ncbi:MAG: DUF2182 domain-containing protein [Rhodobacteraceae bacterium]|nr:MAG: DUF2182 domain-containing protein [Paracoccaceae bacterium]